MSHDAMLVEYDSCAGPFGDDSLSQICGGNTCPNPPLPNQARTMASLGMLANLGGLGMLRGMGRMRGLGGFGPYNVGGMGTLTVDATGGTTDQYGINTTNLVAPQADVNTADPSGVTSINQARADYQNLRVLGYALPDTGNIYDPGAMTSVKQFQTNVNGAAGTVDGLTGPNTRAAIQNAFTSLGNPVSMMAQATDFANVPFNPGPQPGAPAPTPGQPGTPTVPNAPTPAPLAGNFASGSAMMTYGLIAVGLGAAGLLVYKLKKRKGKRK